MTENKKQQPSSDELSVYDALGLAELVHSKQIKQEELLQTIIERVETMDPKLNAIVIKMYDEGKKNIAKGLPEGPFTGVPFTLKDTHGAYAGVPFTQAAKVLADNIPAHDGTLVKRYKDAGLVIIGKTNMSEFGLVPTTEPVLFGSTRNPWNTDYSPGGSSGGAAAVVAARMMPAAHGGDGGGSIRIPASVCGVFGLKPSRGRVPLGPDAGEIMEGCVISHAISISVRDNAALLDVISGPDVGDPYGIPAPQRFFLDEVGADPGKLKIALFTGYGPTQEHPDCIEAVNDVARLCEGLGHTIEVESPEINYEQFTEGILLYFQGHVAATLDRISAMSGRKVTADMVEPLTWSIAEVGWQKSAADFAGIKAIENQITRSLGGFLSRYDVILSPTLPGLPPRLGEYDSVNHAYDDIMERSLSYVRYTAMHNFAGTPAMSVPLYWNKEGLPIGVQFATSYANEALLFRLAGQLEKARPWRDELPALSKAPVEDPGANGAIR